MSAPDGQSEKVYIHRIEDARGIFKKVRKKERKKTRGGGDDDDNKEMKTANDGPTEFDPDS